MTFTAIAMPCKAGPLPTGSRTGAAIAAAPTVGREVPFRRKTKKAAASLPAEACAGALRAALDVLQGAAAQQAPLRAAQSTAFGRDAQMLPAEASWWGAEPMKVYLDLDRIDQGSDESTHLGEPGSVGSQSPRDDGVASERSLQLADTEGPVTAEASASGRCLPSRGSAFHNSGQCKPCAWFWKPQGCENGRECNHCHMCPMGELKRRKQDKIALMQAAQAAKDVESAGPEQPPVAAGTAATDMPEVQASMLSSPWTVPLASAPGPAAAEGEAEACAAAEAPPLEPPPGLEAAEAALPSRGAAWHGSGECRPCAWFWKPQGCANGRDCRHCHACPFGELRNRKQQKAAALRERGLGAAPAAVEASLTGPVDTVDQQCVRPQQPSTRPPQPDDATTKAVAAAAFRAAFAGACEAVAQPQPAAARPAPHPTALDGAAEAPMPPPPQFSRGAALHGAGVCQPCAWFWKPQGCANGQECSRCHLCPEGEVRRRRKVKISAMKQDAQRSTMLEERMLLPAALLD